MIGGYSLSLSLKGSVAWPALAQLTTLQHLDMSGNKLNGTLSTRLPHSVMSLYLESNQFSGALPSDWTSFMNLTVLDVSHNQITGGLPALPPRLESLYIYNNQLNSTIPANWALPSSLHTLSIYSNNLHGPAMPPGLVLPASLEHFDVSNNRLSGTITADFPLPSSLRTLDVSNNLLRGTLPANWLLPPLIQSVNLQNNSLIGKWWPLTASDFSSDYICVVPQ